MGGAALDDRPTVMVVDDDEPLLNALTFGMQVEGYRVLPFTSAEAVLGLQHLPEAHCVLVDQRLERLDGLTLIQILRARGSSVPAILMTSNPGAALRMRCQTLQVPIVEKPLLQEDLWTMIRGALNP